MPQVENQLIFETIADIAWQAGQCGYYSGDSRQDIQDFITWAHEFEAARVEGPEGASYFGDMNYIVAIEEFTYRKINEQVTNGSASISKSQSRPAPDHPAVGSQANAVLGQPDRLRQAGPVPAGDMEEAE